MVEGVKHLHAEVEITPFAEMELLKDGSIEIEVGGSLLGRDRG